MRMKGDGVNDYYVKGEAGQCIRFYIFIALLGALIVVIALAAYDYLMTSSFIDLALSTAYFILSIAIGAVAGVFIYGAFARFKYVRLMLRNSLRASARNFPEVFDAVKLAADRLAVEPTDAYVSQNPAINAFMVKPGLVRGKKVIVLNTGLLSAMEGGELFFIVGHELSHVKYGRRRRIKKWGIPFILGPQYTEYRCDRGGLVACGDIEACVRALLKLVTGKEFIDRVEVKGFEREDRGASAKVLLKLASHPMIDARIRELLRFYNSSEYKKDKP